MSSSSKGPAKNLTHSDKPIFPGMNTEWINTVQIVRPEHKEQIPVYRVLDTVGNVIEPSQDPKVGTQTPV